MNLALSLRAKGGSGLAARAGTIVTRFGLTTGQMTRCLTRYVDLVSRFDTRPTLPITACVLARHPALIRRFVDRGVEFAVHGLVHNDHAALSHQAQRAGIARAIAIFQAAGVPCRGFRGPYLRYNAATDAAVRDLGLLYHSSQAVAFPVLPAGVRHGPRATAYARALHLYRARDAGHVCVRPHDRDGLIDLPVALPDDEVMVDRLHLDPATQAELWLGVLEMTHARGDLFTIQLHPERIDDCAYALETVLQDARLRRPGAWLARLEEVASWWQRRGRARLCVEETGQNAYCVRLDGPDEAALLVRGLPAVDAAAWYGSELVARARCFEVSAPVKPVAGVAPDAPPWVPVFLREEGIPFEVSGEQARYGAYVSAADAADEAALLEQIERGDGPLVRLARWPGGARSALSITGDIDAITIQDFVLRLWEGRR